MQKICKISIVIFAAWISFIAPLNGNNLRVICLAVLSVFPLLSFFSLEHKIRYNDLFLWGFLFFVTLSFKFSAYKQITTEYFLNYIAIAPIIYYMGRSCAESKMRLLFGKAMCIFAVGVTLFGLSEFIMKNNFLYMSIRQNHYFDTFISRRMMSTQIHPAALGTYFVSVIPVSLGLYLAASTKKIRILRLFIFLIITLGAILTLSRGAFLGGVAGISAILLLTRRQKFLKIFSFIVISLFILFTVISSISKAKGHIDYNHLSIDRISLVGLTNPDDYIKKSGRIESGWRIVKDHPFLGLGPGNYRSYFDYYLPNLENQTPYIGKVADLMYLTIISEIGIFGFLIFSLFIFLTLSRSLRDGSAPFLNKDRITLFSFIGGFIGIMFTFLVYDGLYWFVPGCLFWFYSGIISDSGEA